MQVSAGAYKHFPHMSRGILQWELGDTACSISPEQLIPERPADYGGDVTLCVQCASANLQGLNAKHKFLEQQMIAMGYNVLFLQETKCQGGSCVSRDTVRLASEHDRHWGCAVWVSRTFLRNFGLAQLELDHFHVVTCRPRLISVLLKHEGVQILFISAHFPHRAGHDQEKNALLHEFQSLCEQRRESCTIIAGVDANARVELNCGDATGALFFAEPDAAGSKFAELLLNCGMWAPSTHADAHDGPSHTWRHSSGALSRIDYILLGGQRLAFDVRSWTDVELDLLTAHDDHWAVGVSARFCFRGFAMKHRPAKKMAYDRRRMLTDEGRAEFAAELSKLPAIPWSTNVHDHAQLFQDRVLQAMRHCFLSPPTGPRASFITDEVWRLRECKIGLKKRTRRFNDGFRDFVAQSALHRWRGRDFCNWWFRKVRVLRELFAAAITFATQRMRVAIRESRNVALKKLLRTLDGKSAGQIFGEIRAGVGGRSRRKNGGSLPGLVDATGQRIAAMQQLDEFWLHYFNHLEVGTIKDTQTFLDEACRHPPPPCSISLEMVPTLLEVEDTFRGQPLRKACGLDGIPGEALRSCPTILAKHYQPLHAKAVLLGCPDEHV